MKGLILAACCLATQATADYITVQSTTSTQNSGLYDTILPMFTDTTGIGVRVVAVGTGQALKNAQRCDGDMLITHAKEAENTFVDNSFGVARHDVMYNDFVILGPAADPANLSAAESITSALKRLPDAARFVSRADESGTHKKELALWEMAGLDPRDASGTWYRETGSGMGATINAAIAMNAYVISDRATWVAFGQKRDHRILFEDDPDLFNQYGVIVVSPQHCPNVKSALATQFQTWLLSDAGQAAIEAHRVDGQQLFTPNAR